MACHTGRVFFFLSVSTFELLIIIIYHHTKVEIKAQISYLNIRNFTGKLTRKIIIK